MPELKDFEIEFDKINLFAPEGSVSVSFTIKFHAGEGIRYTFINFDIPVKLEENMKIEEVKEIAFERAKTYMGDMVKNGL